MTPTHPSPRRWAAWLAAVLAALLLAGCTSGGSTRSAPAGPTDGGSPADGGGSSAGARGSAPSSGTTVDALSAGAAGDGRTDDTAALQRALDGLSAGDILELPAGRTFAHRGVLTVGVSGVTVTGGGTLLATDERSSALRIAADGVTVRGITAATASTTTRWADPQQTGVWLDEHSDTTLDGVTVRGAGSAGVFVQGTQYFTLRDVTVRNTRADGVHMTGGARYGLVTDPTTVHTGDDGVAVVSYTADRSQAGDIRIQSPHVHGNTHGRGVSVVGGRNVLISGIDVRNTAAAAVYIACERGQFSTRVPAQVTVDGGTIDGANQDTDVDHGAVLVYNAQGDQPISGITVSGLTIAHTRTTASRQVGLVADDGGALLGVTLTALHFTGSGPGRLLATDAGSLRYRASGWTVDGAAVPDRSAGE